MAADSEGLRRGLAERVEADGPPIAPGWRAALQAVPRELFLGDAMFQPVGAGWTPVRRDQMGDAEWLRLVYTDTTWVTQVGGVHAMHTNEPLSGSPTSSSTLPSLVIRMLEAAGIRDGMNVLEIGTGTGYSTALLCHRLGDEHVTSIEYDPTLAALAAERLREAGFRPSLVIGDGLLGRDEGGPYDAIVATCAVRHIPTPWMWQLTDGGTITTTISGWMLTSGLVHLSVAEDGVATGRFTGDPVSFMLARPHERPPSGAFQRFPGVARACRVAPTLLEDWTPGFVAQLAAPSAEIMNVGGDVMLRDVATGSQAWTHTTAGGAVVHQHGPLRLWDQIEEALTTWQAAGSPDQAEFGLTVSDDLTQTVWIGEPDGPSWPLPV